MYVIIETVERDSSVIGFAESLEEAQKTMLSAMRTYESKFDDIDFQIWLDGVRNPELSKQCYDSFGSSATSAWCDCIDGGVDYKIQEIADGKDTLINDNLYLLQGRPDSDLEGVIIGFFTSKKAANEAYALICKDLGCNDDECPYEVFKNNLPLNTIILDNQKYEWKQEKAEVLTTEVPTGTVKAYPNTDPTMPGMTVMLQPKGEDYEIDLCYIESPATDEAAELDKCQVGDILIRTYADPTTEDYTNKECLGKKELEEMVEANKDDDDPDQQGLHYSAYKTRCCDCACLTEVDGRWFCDEAQEFCSHVFECPEGED